MPMLISDFARLGQVTVRMLHHYDDLGLLRPAAVDAHSGYRSYAPEQLHDLNRLIALKDLGFTLDQVGTLLVEGIGAEELRGMLRLRQAQLEQEARAVGIRLAAVETRLGMIEKESTMSADYVIKQLPAMRLVSLTATLDPADLGTHIGPMFDAVAADLDTIKGALDTPVATYQLTEAGQMDVVVGYAWTGEPPAGTEAVDLPATRAVCGVHLGPMSGIHASWQSLHSWLVANAHEFSGPCRELYVRAESDDQADWVTELQQPIAG